MLYIMVYYWRLDKNNCFAGGTIFMGLIKVGVQTVGGTLSDQWLEAIEPLKMDNETILSVGVDKNPKKKDSKVISDGSVVHVGENQMMLLVDGGKIIDYSGEPGYFKVSSQNAPSLFNGDFGGALSDAFNRFKFGGQTPYSQRVVYINTQEIQNIPFGTVNPINYFDEFYNAELYIRAHGFFSIKVTNPVLFYGEAASKDADHIGITDMQKLYLSEFLTALQTAIGTLSVEGERISHLTSKTTVLAKEMAEVLDDDWEGRRGFKIESVGINSLSYDEKSKELIDIRNKGAMLGDPNIRTGYVQGSAARGIEEAGKNPAGATTGFMGVGMGMGAASSFVGDASQINQAQAQQQESKATKADSWVCAECSSQNNGGKFCASCGSPRPTSKHCTNCGASLAPGAKFCSECGTEVK